jgi:hypothetical protein
MLSTSSHITEQYNAFVEAKIFSAEEYLPTVKKARKNKFSNHPTVVKARKLVQKLNKRYTISKSGIMKKHLKEARALLQSEYQRLEEELLNHQIGEVEKDFTPKTQRRFGKWSTTLPTESHLQQES